MIIWVSNTKQLSIWIDKFTYHRVSTMIGKFIHPTITRKFHIGIGLKWPKYIRYRISSPKQLEFHVAIGLKWPKYMRRYKYVKVNLYSLTSHWDFYIVEIWWSNVARHLNQSVWDCNIAGIIRGVFGFGRGKNYETQTQTECKSSVSVRFGFGF